MAERRLVSAVLVPAAAVAPVLRGVRDEELERPTPCPGMPVAAMLDHLAGLGRVRCGGSEDFWTARLADPDGSRFELVQWPAGRPDAMTEAALSGQVATGRAVR